MGALAAGEIQDKTAALGDVATIARQGMKGHVMLKIIIAIVVILALLWLVRTVMARGKARA